MSDSNVSYFNALAPSAPSPLRNQLLALPHDTLVTVDTLLRFVLGSPCPLGTSKDLRATWETAQQEVAERIAQLKKSHPGTSSGSESDNRKRAREDESGSTSKRAKMSQDPASSESDPPRFTLHALSLTSPIRKKADITIHAHTLRLTHPTTRVLEVPPIPLAGFHRAFLLPTRGKTKPHWTVVLMPSDVPAVGGKTAKEKEEVPLVVFGLDATPVGFSTTSHSPDSKTSAHPKGTPAHPSLQTFFSHLPIPILEPSTDVFRSAFVGGSSMGGSANVKGAEGVAGVEAYRGAKQGTLWFLDEGVLWDGKPAEFFALKDLAKNGKQGEVEGIRIISATGRTCSVILRRVEAGEGKGKRTKEDEKSDDRDEEEEEEEEDEEERVVDVDFGMIDGKEQEGIARWIKKHRHLFGRRDLPSSQVQAAPQSKTTNGVVSRSSGTATNAVATTSTNPNAEDESDEEDSDFVDDSSSDGGSATSESEDEDGDAASGGSEAGAESTGDEAGDGEEEKEEDGDELDPGRHPLMRPGAMPRMSRAAMNAVVGMMTDDLIGGAGTSDKGGRKGRRPASEQSADEEDDEDDELED